jgi:pyruvate dehydrogenase E2 component (dihydrolipoamide acetyltransferase)
MSEITMPRLSESMQEGTILRWLKQDDDLIASDDELVEIDTDKAVMTVNAEVEGVLRIVAAEGTTVDVGAVIANVGPASEARAPEAAVTAERGGANGGGPGAVPPAPAVSEPLPAPAVSTAWPAPASAPSGRPAPVTATPLARRAALTHGVELDELKGTGPRGRITRADVLAAAGVAPGPDPVPPEPDGAARQSPQPAVEQLTRVQQVIAQRMTESKSTIPEFEVQTEVLADEVLSLRTRLQELAGEGPAPSINDVIVKACAVALRNHPRVNSSFLDGGVRLHPRISIGFAVARPGALIVPVVHDADQKPLGVIAGETRRLAERVRSGEITPDELSGATFTISNLGMYGMTAIRPVINPPQVAILGVGASRGVLARVDGEIVERSLMTLTLTADHRVLYGADAAEFLSNVGTLLELPLRMLL